MRYYYIHLWASDEEIRVQCTDSKTITLLEKSINAKFEDCSVSLKNDLDEEPYVARIIAMPIKDRHQKIVWWLFKLLCNHGWDPIETGSHWFKMKFSRK